MRRSRSRRPSTLTVRAQRRAGELTRFEVSGHAGFAAAGSDIVCAAVSALVMTAAHGVARICAAPVRISDDPSGAFVLDVPGGGGAAAQAVLESTLAGLRAIAHSYPGHLRVTVRNAPAHSPRPRATGARRRTAERSAPRKGV